MTQFTSYHHDTFLSSPMPGKVIRILTQEGERVEEGQSVFIMESMKMLHELRMPKPGKVSGIQVKVGDVVQPNNHLAYIL